LAVLGLTGLPAGAAGDGCPTWLPDFSPDCERQARPPGAVMPLSFPYLFEDPYVTTGLNFVGIWHDFPSSVAGLPFGGQLGVLALQIRLALTDRLAFIATKDGVGFLDTSGASPVRDDTGVFNLTPGLKYQLVRWEGEVVGDDHSFFLTPSLRYEIPIGNRAVLQDHDDGIFIPALSTAYSINDFHGIFGIGGQIPINSSKNSQNLFYNFHVDYAYPLGEGTLTHVVPFVEWSGIHWTQSGRGNRLVNLEGSSTVNVGAVPGFEGVDVANLGNLLVSGNDYLTMAVGLRLPFRNGLSLGASYEWPLSNVNDLTDQRVTMMLTWEL
jgi:hypothetical protein